MNRVLLLIFKVFLLFYCTLPLAEEAFPWKVTSDEGAEQIVLYFFWSPTCPHCQEAHEHIDNLPQQYPWLTLRSFNIFEPEKAQQYRQMALALGEQARSVPGFFICERMYVGWDSFDGMGQVLIKAAQQCRGGNAASIKTKQTVLQVPVLGDVEMGDYSLPLFTLLVAGMDAFNPCAFFVLLFLLSLLVHARSRARMMLIGGVFVIISGVVYFVFMSAWLNLFLVMGSLPWVTLVAGTVAVLFGSLGVKDFLFSLKGPSLSISSRAKPKLYGRMRKLLTTDSLPALLTGTVALALAANSYELLCTAGFPMVYTRMLTLHNLEQSSYYAYLVLYNLIYVVPLIVIVLLFTITLGARKLTLDEGRLLKLLSGVMMLGLGVVLLVKPEWLNSVVTGASLLVVSLFITLIAWGFLKYSRS